MGDLAAATEMPERSVIRAAEYVRMSTDHQRYSSANQSEVIRAYAATREIMIVRTYADEGKSGLSLKHRPALNRLINDVQSGSADFSVILVYDVTRWGRFQDSDESGYYEYLCKRVGITVHYCAEQFENDGSSFSSVIKNIKRAMAGEYSRELSAKVFAGQSRLVKLGYHVSGAAPFGLRRLLVDQHDRPKSLLANGERKSIQTDRIKLVPGEPSEVEIVRWIFHAFVNQKMLLCEIARQLNLRGVKNGRGAPWIYQNIRDILCNENYIGNLVWNRRSTKLKTKEVNNPDQQWIRAVGVIEPIVNHQLFERAQARSRERAARPSQMQMLLPLRRLLKKHGTLNVRLINRARGVPSASAYTRWFGNLSNAYKLVGFTKGLHCRDGRPRRSRDRDTRALTNEHMLQILRHLLNEYGYLSAEIINATQGAPSARTYWRRFGSLGRAYDLIGLADKIRQPERRQRSCRVITRSLTDEEVLAALRTLRDKVGYLTEKIIARAPGVPTASTYIRRFGSLPRAYQLIRYDPKNVEGVSQSGRRYTDKTLIALLRGLLAKKGFLSQRLVNQTPGIAFASTYHRRFGSFKRACALARHRDEAKTLEITVGSTVRRKKRRKC